MIVNFYGWSFLIVMMDNTYILIHIVGHSETFPATRRIFSGVKLQTCAFLVTKNRESSDFSDFTTKNSWVHQSSLSHPVSPVPWQTGSIVRHSCFWIPAQNQAGGIKLTWTYKLTMSYSMNPVGYFEDWKWSSGHWKVLRLIIWRHGVGKATPLAGREL